LFRDSDHHCYPAVGEIDYDRCCFRCCFRRFYCCCFRRFYCCCCCCYPAFVVVITVITIDIGPGACVGVVAARLEQNQEAPGRR
jgi:hypothetical protein